MSSDDEPLPEGEEQAPRGTRVMAGVRWFLIVLMAAIAVAAWFSYWGVLEKHQAHSGASRQNLYYCPMHPSVVQDHPGECPICSMTLVPKPEGGAPAGATKQQAVPGLSPIDLSPERVQLTGMRTAVARRESLAPKLRTVGYVAANEKGLARVETRFAGWIETLAVSQTGAKVHKGEVLAAIYSPELYAAEQELLDANRWKKESGGAAPEGHAMTAGLTDDARHRLELLGIAREDIDDIVRSGKPVRAIKVRSPVDGYVTTKNAVEGIHVQPGTELFEVADLSTVWILADIHELEATRVQVGEEARFQSTSAPGKPLVGRIDFLYPTVDAGSRTLRARIVFPNPGLRLRPGMYGDVEVDLGAASGVIVPSDAIVDTGEEQYVFVAQERGHFEPRRVTLGARSDGKVAVLEGLVAGETVVTTANFLLDSESRLRSAIEGTAHDADDASVPIDRQKYPDKYQQWKQCERVHRGMGTMEEDCQHAIPKPWK